MDEGKVFSLSLQDSVKFILRAGLQLCYCVCVCVLFVMLASDNR